MQASGYKACADAEAARHDAQLQVRPARAFCPCTHSQSRCLSWPAQRGTSRQGALKSLSARHGTHGTGCVVRVPAADGRPGQAAREGAGPRHHTGDTSSPPAAMHATIRPEGPPSPARHGARGPHAHAGGAVWVQGGRGRAGEAPQGGAGARGGAAGRGGGQARGGCRGGGQRQGVGVGEGGARPPLTRQAVGWRTDAV